MDSEDKLQLQKKDQKKSPERIKRPPILSPLKRPPSLRLVSPFDSDQELNDLEVASVLADEYSEDDSCISPTKKAADGSRPTTVMTNLQRGNVQTTTPLPRYLNFHQMAAQGEIKLLQQEISEGADVNRCDDVGGLTALLWAAAYGQLTTIEFLLENDGDLNAIGGNGENCLLLASAGGYKDIVRMCLQKGQQVNYVDETGSTALIYAAYRNHPGVVQVLLEHGADITIHNEDEMTAMDLAVGQGNTAVRQTIDKHMLSLFGE
ncbi:uncharacterized protein LOC143071732 [Mytilus galloprovincialis]|uniref:uncharacterized protein LOC143071732 n=1 Tax=Mytilus galloprovincialis TaxID=29158 RepID=UPI003F7C082A